MKQIIEITKCDFCRKEINTKESYVYTDSGIEDHSWLVFYDPTKENQTKISFDEEDFCDFECFINWIKKNANK